MGLRKRLAMGSGSGADGRGQQALFEVQVVYHYSLSLIPKT